MELRILLNKIVDKQNLSYPESMELMEEIFQGRLSPALIASFLTALRMKEETVDEILGSVTVMRKHMVEIKTNGLVIDVCGTGGDGKGTFNISTAVALVVAGAGIPVAKHGNRNASSLCGSADVLEALGVNINLGPKQAESLLKKTNFTFLFAPIFHPAMKNVAQVRKELKIRTVFNFLGPFVSPARVKRQIIGVPNIQLAEKLANVATQLNYEYLLLFSSEDGMDEISLSSMTHLFEVKGKKVKKMIINPKELGYEKTDSRGIKGGDAKTNVAIIKSIFNGEGGTCRDIVILNSAVALLVSSRVKDLREGLLLAEESIREGRANRVLEMAVQYSNL